MRHSFTVRLSLVFCGALSLGALTVPAAEATPRVRHVADRVARHGDHHATHRRGRARANVRRTGPGSPYALLRTDRLVRWHPDRLERRHTSPFHETDSAAVQNIFAAVGGEDDLLVRSSLEPLGILALPPCRITINGAVTPRSPRGPPSFRA